MDILQTAAKIFLDKIGQSGDQLELSHVMDALSGLLGNQGQFDLSALLAQLQSGGLANMAASWLGNGANAGMSVQQLMETLGQDKVLGFAESLGLNESIAARGLADMIPQLIDQKGGAGDLINVAGGMLGKFFK